MRRKTRTLDGGNPFILLWIGVAVVGLIAVVISFLMTSPAQAATLKCGLHKQVTEFLANKYKETRVGMGLINAGQMMELYISETGSWTMLITRPDGVTCFGPVGKNWQHIKPKPAGTKS